MVWRETIPIFQARSMVNSIEPGATIARASRYVRIVVGMGARGVAGKTLRRREVRG
jgi:hypothetical protein